MFRSLKIILIFLFTIVISNSALATDQTVREVFDFIKKNQAQVMSTIWQEDHLIWRAYMQNRACKNKEQAQRLYSIVPIDANKFVAAMSEAYQQAGGDQDVIDNGLLDDLSSFAYFAYTNGYIKGYIYRAHVYLKYYAEIKNEFCDLADVNASAELDQFYEKHQRKMSNETIKSLKLYKEYGSIYANYTFGQAAFHQLFRKNAPFIDAYVFAIILNKNDDAMSLLNYIQSIDVKIQYSVALLAEFAKQGKLKTRTDWALDAKAYDLYLGAYTRGFLSVYSQMKNNYPEINEKIENFMPKFLATSMEKLAQLQKDTTE
ncbi:MAG: hypothetical protein COB35_03960 [Gammaproteobacteria bacterium]|nr:MAG: hypothetical protein COB35_03960 [Gammaproteobacteria bacterium]